MRAAGGALDLPIMHDRQHQRLRRVYAAMAQLKAVVGAAFGERVQTRCRVRCARAQRQQQRHDESASSHQSATAATTTTTTTRPMISQVVLVRPALYCSASWPDTTRTV